MTAEERARGIHRVIDNAYRARSKALPPWDQLTPEKREKLIAAAARLESEYGSAGDSPSRGLAADEVTPSMEDSQC